jgi:tetratricopeptide (TPR) repeat protein
VQAGEPRQLGDVLVAIGAVPQRELERHVRRQIEAVVFELLSWSEGFFSFEDGSPGTDTVDPDVGLTAEALLMEAARRIDEWARMSDRIPNAEVVPTLADAAGDSTAALDLRPHEWQVLAAIDGSSDLGRIAILAGLSEFDVARVVYGLLSTGVVTVAAPAIAPVTDDALVHLSDAREADRDGRAADALAAAERAIGHAPGIAEAHAIAGLALLSLDRFDEADRRLRHALALEPGRTEWMMPAARLAIRRGDLASAVALWTRVVSADAHAPAAALARDALEQATRLHAMAGGNRGR